MWKPNSSHFNYLKSFLKKILILRDNLLGVMYVYQGKKLLGLNEIGRANTLLKRGISRFPYNYKLNIELALLEMDNKNYEQAVKHWKTVFRTNKRLKPFNYLKYSEALQKINQINKSIEVLIKGKSKFPGNKAIICKLANVAIETNKWEKAVIYLEEYFKISKGTIPNYNKYLALSNAYKKIDMYNEAEKVLIESLESHSNKSENTYKLLVDIAIERKNWTLAIDKLESFSNKTLEDQIKLAMLYQIIGNRQKSNEIYQHINFDENLTKKADNKYRKIVVFDNGESRIEFYKGLQETDSVIITFDSINMEWQDPSFAFKLLTKQKLDIVAVRKRKKRTYQQDLHQQDFKKVVSPLIVGYKDKMAYGFSLGAYNALYHASLINCRILAFSPRLSIHPDYGRTKVIPKFSMEHNKNHSYNKDISPIIVYDPKNELDNTYINRGIIPYFPKSVLIKVPYGGHGIAPHLLKMGVLKNFVLSFIMGEVPNYDRKLKGKSNIYFRNLGNQCLKHNKFTWALNLVEKSLEMLPSDINAIKLKIKALKKLNRMEEAREFAIESIELVPNSLDLRLYLIDICIELYDLKRAQREIEYTIKRFGNKKNVLRRNNKLREIIAST